MSAELPGGRAGPISARGPGSPSGGSAGSLRGGTAAPPRRRRTFVTPNARRRGDRAGDPLEGLVNLFDLGIVLAVAFLLAALSSLKLSSLLTSHDVTVVKKGAAGQSTVIVKHGEHVRTIELSGARVVGKGEPIGQAYRLSDGRVVIVTKQR